MDTHLEIVEVDAIDGIEYVAEHPQGASDTRKQLLVCGRPLGDREIGASLSHRLAYEAGLNSAAEWVVIVEDDLRVLPDSEDALLRTIPIGLSRATIVNLQPGGGPGHICPTPRGRQRKPPRSGWDTCVEVSGLPPFAQAYALNRAALEVASQAPQTPVTTPDWPPWTASCIALVPRARIFGGEEGSSVIAERGLRPLNERRAMTQGEIILRVLKRVFFVSWIGAKEHYLSLDTYRRREFVNAYHRLRHRLRLARGRDCGVPDWLKDDWRKGESPASHRSTRR